MNGKRIDRVEELVMCANAQDIKDNILSLLRRLGALNRVEAMRVGNDIINFTADCVSNIGAKPINGGARKWFCDREDLP